MGGAIDYTLTIWPMLLVYLEDGRVEIDNNPVENDIRPTAIGKKNWLIICEAEAGQRSAILFTIIDACRSRSKLTISGKRRSRQNQKANLD